MRISDFGIENVRRRASEGIRNNSASRNPQFEIRNPKFSSAFNADYLLDLGDDLDQIALVAHHLFDVFVSAGNFIQHAYVFTTFNAGSLTSEVVFGEGSLRSAA
jgi:hypothetical protein